MPDSDPAAPGDANLVSAARSYLKITGGRLLNVSGVFGVVTDVPLSFFNVMPVTSIAVPSDDPRVEERIAAALAVYSVAGMPCRWWVTPRTRPRDLAPVLMRCGMRRHYDAPEMVADLRGSELEPPLPAGVIIEPVRDDAALARFSTILMRAFGRPVEVAINWQRAFGAIGLGAESSWQHFVAAIEGEPVATASVHLGGGVAGLYHVGTLPEARGRGAGNAATCAALLEGRRRGYTTGVLQSSESGLNLYRRLGFRTVATVQAFELP